jgi:predicted nucleic acid-binding protein
VRVLAYSKFRLEPADREALLTDYLPFAETVALPDPPPDVPACRDRDDLPFLQLALHARVDALVSGDAAVQALRGVTSVPVLTATELRERLASP